MKNIAEQIDQLIGNLGYWPSRSAFVREAYPREAQSRVETGGDQLSQGVSPAGRGVKGPGQEASSKMDKNKPKNKSILKPVALGPPEKAVFESVNLGERLGPVDWINRADTSRSVHLRR